MARRTTHTYYGFDMPDVVLTLPDFHEQAGEHRGELRAWAVDDDTGDWWANVQYRTGPGEQFLAWLPADQVRRDADLTDERRPR